METTIQISKDLAKELQTRKFSDKESYENVIWGMIEDCLELSEETKKELAEARKDIAEGRVKSISQIKKELGL